MTKIDEIMTNKNLSNHHLVAAAHSLGMQLTHKTVQKARLGSRELSPKMQGQIIAALNEAIKPEIAFTNPDIF